MPCHQKKLLILLLALIHFSCNYNSKETDHLTFKINIYPAFEEYAEILLTKKDSLKAVSMYLENLKRPDIPNDTFWYTKKNLTNDQYRLLDSVLIKKWGNRTDTSGFKVVDGISIYSVLFYKSDTSRMVFQSPNIKRDSIAFAFTNSIFTILPIIFKDSVSTEYFAEMEEYIDASKNHKASRARKIDRMRMEKYHWTIK
jgi:hypothetical protein